MRILSISLLAAAAAAAGCATVHPEDTAAWVGQPASVLGLSTRGRIAPGCHADLVAFDPDTVGTGPLERIYDFPGGTDRLVAPSVGIVHTWVNGEAIWTDGAAVPDAAAGRLLREFV